MTVASIIRPVHIGIANEAFPIHCVHDTSIPCCGQVLHDVLDAFYVGMSKSGSERGECPDSGTDIQALKE